MSERERYTTSSEWEDFLPILEPAVQEMGSEQLIHDRDFHLSQAMTATEIMDPKTDSGLGVYSDAGELIRNGKAPQNLIISHMLSVMDRLLILESQWFKQDTLIQTVFTCLYYHQDGVVECPVMAAYLKTLLRTVNAVKKIFSRADLFEEDFCQNYGFNMAEDVSNNAVHNMMKTAEEVVMNSDWLTGKSAAISADKPTLTNALLSRLRLRRALFELHNALDVNKCSGITNARKWIKVAQRNLSLVSDSVHLSSPETAVGFAPDINQPLFTHVPARCVTSISMADSIQYIETILKEIDRAVDVYDCTSLEEISMFLTDFSRRSSLVSRSHLLLLLLSNGKVFGQIPLSSLVLKSLKITRAVGEIDYVQDYVERLTMPLRRLFSTFCHTLPMQHRLLPKRMADWNSAVNSAEKVDVLLHHRYFDESEVYIMAKQTAEIFTGWSMNILCKIMARYLEIALKLGLCSVHELPAIYGYLFYLYRLIESQLRSRQALYISHEQLSSKKSKKGKQGKTSVLTGPPDMAPEEYNFIELSMWMTRASQMMLIGLRSRSDIGVDDLQLSKPSFLNSAKLRLSQRFAPFLGIDNPQPLTFEYLTQSSPKGSFESANAAFTSISQILTRLQMSRVSPESEADIEVWKTNLAKQKIILSLLLKKIDLTGMKLSIEILHDNTYPVFTLSKKS